MADESDLPASLQESLLAALVFDDKFGTIISGQVGPQHFDGPYREVAEKVLAYRRKYQRPPGQAHLDDLFGTSLAESNKRAPRLRRILFGLVAVAEGLNAEYVAAQVQTFIRRQQLKAAVINAGARIQQGGDELVTDVEGILHEALRFRQHTLDSGTFLNDPKGLSFLDSAGLTYSLGIPELDRLGIGPAPKELLLYIAPKGSGKSWFSVHCGRLGFINRHRVLHVTLELREDKVIGRYYQSLFSVAQWSGKQSRAVLEFDSLKRFSGLSIEKYNPKLSLDDPNIRTLLRSKMKPWGVRMGSLVVKEFPTGSLTLGQLSGYLDHLELIHRFIPNIIIVDYPDLMFIDPRDYRNSLDVLYKGLRGIAGERNCAMIAPTQSNRDSLKASRTGSHMVAEDIRKVNTSDVVLAYSRTEAEKRLGLARLHVEHARDAEDGQTVLMSQSYATGQYVIQSAMMQGNYWQALQELSGEDDGK